MINAFTGPSLIVNPADGFSTLPFTLTVTNQSYQAPDGNIWLPTEKGVVLLKQQIFSENRSRKRKYLCGVSSASGRWEAECYFCSKEHLRSYTIGHPEAKVIDIRLKGYYQSLQLDGENLWASNVYQILQYDTEGKLRRTFDFNQYGRFIFDMMLDPDKNLWFTQEASIGLKQIDTEGNLHIFAKEQGLRRS
ncbi:MAG: hypothetical protein U5K79_10570 [Cyclobacteriaceae bacterium]|nr:hypothetical protein [Cyclobacteriaceae bacterium]